MNSTETDHPPGTIIPIIWGDSVFMNKKLLTNQNDLVPSMKSATLKLYLYK